MVRDTICNIDFSKKILIYGFITILILIAIIIFLYSVYGLNKEQNILAYTSVIALATGLLSFLMNIVSMYNSNEQSSYELAYEDSKQSTIYFYNLVKHLTKSQNPKNKVKCFDLILGRKIDLEYIEYLKKWSGVGVSKDGLVYTFFLDDLTEFKKKNMIYNLSPALVEMIDDLLKNKEEVSNEDMDNIIKIIKNHLETEFKLYIP